MDPPSSHPPSEQKSHLLLLPSTEANLLLLTPLRPKLFSSREPGASRLHQTTDNNLSLLPRSIKKAKDQRAPYLLLQSFPFFFFFCPRTQSQHLLHLFLPLNTQKRRAPTSLPSKSLATPFLSTKGAKSLPDIRSEIPLLLRFCSLSAKDQEKPQTNFTWLLCFPSFFLRTTTPRSFPSTPAPAKASELLHPASAMNSQSHQASTPSHRRYTSGHIRCPGPGNYTTSGSNSRSGDEWRLPPVMAVKKKVRPLKLRSWDAPSLAVEHNDSRRPRCTDVSVKWSQAYFSTELASSPTWNSSSWQDSLSSRLQHNRSEFHSHVLPPRQGSPPLMSPPAPIEPNVHAAFHPLSFASTIAKGRVSSSLMPSRSLLLSKDCFPSANISLKPTPAQVYSNPK